jgi:hypothetical protein
VLYVVEAAAAAAAAAETGLLKFHANHTSLVQRI